MCILVPNPYNVNVINCIMLFKKKLHVNGFVGRYKACLVSNSPTQRMWIDYEDMFILMAKPTTICIVLSLIVSQWWYIQKLDIKSTFLHGDLHETVSMHQSMAFRDHFYPNQIYTLQGLLYWLKKDPSSWIHMFHFFLSLA